MAKIVYLLCRESNVHGGMIVERVFESEDDLRAYVLRDVTLSFTNPHGKLNVSLPAGCFYVHKFVLPESVSEKMAVDFPLVPDENGIVKHVTVESSTHPGVFYGVAIDKQGCVQGCTCPDFMYRGGFCKHMWEAKESWHASEGRTTY